METIAVTDLYQASYLLLSGCTLNGITCTEGSKEKPTCTLYFTGQNVEGLKENWFKKRANVNLWAFRLAYGQIHESIREAKKEYSREKEAGGEE